VNKISLLYSLALIVAYTNVIAGVEINPKGYKRIECVIKPISRAGEKPRPHPHLPYKEATSNNWSGYVSATNLTSPAPNSVTAVGGTWIVPTISASGPSSSTYSSIWVGIDGFSSATVEQIGTEHDWSNGVQTNIAWFEMYPDYPYEISNFPVHVGDSITGSVVYIGNGVFVLALFNNTQKVYSVVPTSYTTTQNAQRSSAEWIVEAPYENGVLPLSEFSPVNFSNCCAIINNLLGSISNQPWQQESLTMVASVVTPMSIPSALSNNGENFTVTWNHQ